MVPKYAIIAVVMRAHLLQSRNWQSYTELEGYKTFWIEGEDYQALAILHHTKLGNYLFCPYGPTLDPNSPLSSLKHALSALQKLAKEQQAFFVRIEPIVELHHDTLKKLDLVKSHDIEPAHTWVLDLTPPQTDLIDRMEKNKARAWRNYTKKGISIRTTKDPEEITILTNLLQQVAERDKFTPQDEKHLKNQLESGFATLYVAEIDKQPIAASLVYDYDGIRYYAHAAANDDYRKLSIGAILLIQMIIDAKNTGAHEFDFWGVTTSDDPSHPWYGFTRFKKSFGGQIKNYSGTWDLPIHPVKYRLYQMVRHTNRLVRKIRK